jgi:hypothetical protein
MVGEKVLQVPEKRPLYAKNPDLAQRIRWVTSYRGHRAKSVSGRKGGRA